MTGRKIAALLLIAAGLLCLDCSSSAEKREHEDKPAPVDVQTLMDANFDAVVLRSEVPVLVDFWATWCHPCKQQAPIVEELAKLYAGRVVMGKLDVDVHGKTSRRYNIEALPTLLIFKDGAVVKKIVGLTSKQALKAALDAALK